MSENKDVIFDEPEVLDKVEEMEVLEESPILDKINISLDMLDEDVLSYTQQGREMFWNDGFRELKEDTVRGLSPANKSRYMLA